MRYVSFSHPNEAGCGVAAGQHFPRPRLLEAIDDDAEQRRMTRSARSRRRARPRIL